MCEYEDKQMGRYLDVRVAITKIIHLPSAYLHIYLLCCDQVLQGLFIILSHSQLPYI
ncbi:hypothetical protein SAMN04488505_102658 [Chitinophaga rupis]|uniref:Uncharacterized protein n=1 Tax=Chitinophaga rupis TaxID=573321 RepID=A0A1H7RJX3_9BACT|nr:hypothetical protein SAMN04488505_102658 [Chitinophaga rupis]